MYFSFYSSFYFSFYFSDLERSEYTAKATKADAPFGAQGSSAVREALRALPQVRGIALRAFVELSEYINLLKEGLAH